VNLIAHYAREDEQMALLHVMSYNRHISPGNEQDVACHEGAAAVAGALEELEREGLKLITYNNNKDNGKDNASCTDKRPWWETDETKQLTVTPVATPGDALWNKALTCADMHNVENFEYRSRWTTMLVRVHPDTGRLCIALGAAGEPSLAAGGVASP
jgi:hypothetical protein